VEISDLREAVAELKQKQAEEITDELLSQGVDPLKVLEDGIVKGLNGVGARFRTGQSNVADLNGRGVILAEARIRQVQAIPPKQRLPGNVLELRQILRAGHNQL
jgi:methanogenic corrinoid protein MtbC1